MKKAFLALASTGFVTAAAQAQTSLTIYGSIDAGLRYQTNTNAAGDNTLSLSSGTYYANRLGFRASEELGGGLRARFNLESGFFSDTGTLDNTNNALFNRTASVGLGGSWGYIDLGRLYTVAFRTEVLYDPFNHRFTGIIPVLSGAGTSLPAAASAAGLSATANSGTRFNNDIQYIGTFGQVTLRAEYALGEVAGSTRRGAAQAVGLSYAGNAFTVGGAYTKKQTAAGFDNDAYTAGGAYTLGDLRLFLGYSNEEQETAAAGNYRNKILWTGASYKLSPSMELTGAFYRSKFDSTAGDGKRNLFIIGMTHAVSKRTNFYAAVDTSRYDGALVPTAGQTRQTGISTGIMHTF